MTDFDHEAWRALIGWRWATKRAALKVYLGLLKVRRGCGSSNDTFTASLRQIAEASGVGSIWDDNTRTVGRALDTLADLGAIRRSDAEIAEAFQANRSYELVPSARWLLADSCVSEGNTPLRQLHEVENLWGSNVHYSLVNELTHPLWEAAALGLGCCRAYYLLSARGGMTAAQLAAMLGSSKRSVHNWLPKLESVGMAEHQGSAWRAIAVDLDDVAAGVYCKPHLVRQTGELAEVTALDRTKRRRESNDLSRERFRKRFEDDPSALERLQLQRSAPEIVSGAANCSRPGGRACA
jgi:hypothetical protein